MKKKITLILLMIKAGKWTVKSKMMKIIMIIKNKQKKMITILLVFLLQPLISKKNAPKSLLKACNSSSKWVLQFSQSKASTNSTSRKSLLIYLTSSKANYSRI